MPRDLTDTLTKIVYEELGLTGYEDPGLPDEYKSDEWWKRAGL